MSLPTEEPKTALDLRDAIHRLPASQKQKVKQEFSDSLFVSHTSYDAHVLTSQIVPFLRQHFRYSVFYENYTTPGSQFYAPTVGQALLVCKTVLMIVSENLRRSTWMPAEISLASEERKPTIVLRLDSTDLRSLHPWFASRDFVKSRRNVTVVDAVENMESALTTLATLFESPTWGKRR